jgi:hypothetical protein
VPDTDTDALAGCDPSPQLIVALGFDTGAVQFVAYVATRPLKAAPSVAVTGWALATPGAIVSTAKLAKIAATSPATFARTYVS